MLSLSKSMIHTVELHILWNTIANLEEHQHCAAFKSDEKQFFLIRMLCNDSLESRKTLNSKSKQEQDEDRT